MNFFSVSFSGEIASVLIEGGPSGSSFTLDDLSFEIERPVTCGRLPLTMDCTVNGVANQLCQGTGGGDNINGTAGDDVINGLGGNDTINGFDGDDVICGGKGNDRINGGKGSDFIGGGPGGDTLDGGTGTDRCNGGGGADSAKRCEKVINVP